MNVHALRVVEPGTVEAPDGNAFDVLMLQAHVLSAIVWLVVCLTVCLIAVPRLRRIPSATLLHELQVRREMVVGALWGTFVVTLGTGTYLLFQQAAYDPPFSGGDWSDLEEVPYGLPYYLALYGKIGLFLAMGAASLVLSTEASRASRLSEAAGGPVEIDPDLDLEDWMDPEVGPGGEEIPLELEGEEAGTTRLAAKQAALTPRFSLTALWASVGTMGVGLLGVGVCVTLIKYFHELSRAAQAYEVLRLR